MFEFIARKKKNIGNNTAKSSVTAPLTTSLCPMCNLSELDVPSLFCNVQMTAPINQMIAISIFGIKRKATFKQQVFCIWVLHITVFQANE